MKKKIPCPFCMIRQSQLTRHIERTHSNEPEVRKIARKCEKLDGKGLHDYRRIQFKKLALRGCAQFNAQTRQRGGNDEELIATKSTTNAKTQYLECPEYYWLLKDLKRHRCLVSKSQTAKKSVKRRAKRRMAALALSANMPLTDLLADMQ